MPEQITVKQPGASSGCGAPAATDDSLAIANRLRPVLLRLNRHLRGEAHDMGVTSTQATLLASIKRTPGIGLGELAAQEHMCSPTLVSHIDKLESAGLVERTRSDPRDRRRVELHLTPDGLQAWNTLVERRTAWLATRLATVSPEELSVIAAAIDPLQKLVRHETRDAEGRQA